MNCPQDRTPLIAHRRDGVEAYRCIQCQGVWLSRSALETLAKNSAPTPGTEPPLPSTGFVHRNLPCPVCAASQLQTRFQGQIQISRCRECGGIWLPKSEVSKLVTARKASSLMGAQPSSPTSRPGAGASADLAGGLVETMPLVALEVVEGSEIGAVVGDFLASFLG
ncbi:MAG: hypothetical protein EBS05_25190 [Proteobacteria bacterium]|nr:hypothetical protein [Pseudomonadota bacterium]